MPRIEEMYAFVAEESGPDDEGVVAMNLGNIMLPLVGADMDRMNSLKPMAKGISVKIGKRVKLLRFTQREDLGDV